MHTQRKTNKQMLKVYFQLGTIGNIAGFSMVWVCYNISYKSISCINAIFPMFVSLLLIGIIYEYKSKYLKSDMLIGYLSNVLVGMFVMTLFVIGVN
ncbi:hypothetical protein KY334_07130 [Candidatus Woesearchaeota archaeon]|nr:hypothetical protein [Candidatus Woesearchaeota archaeon]